MRRTGEKSTRFQNENDEMKALTLPRNSPFKIYVSQKNSDPRVFVLPLNLARRHYHCATSMTAG